MTNFDRFRKKNLNKIVSTDKVNSSFVLEGYPTAVITFSNGEQQTVSLVNKQEQGCAYVFTKQCEPLNIGEVFTCKDLHLMATEKITIIKDVAFNKYLALHCNVELNGEWGFFKGPEASYINLTLKKDTVALSQQKPILVVKQGLFKHGDTVVINNRPWLIIESDETSNSVIGYYSLQPTTVSKEKDGGAVVRPPQVDEPADGEVKPLQEIVLDTEMAYYECNKNMKNLDITLDQVKFIVPFGIDEFIVQVKQQGAIKQIKYKVVK